MNPKNVWPAVTLASVGMAVVGLMAFLKVDKDTIYLISGTFALPVLAALLAAQQAGTNAKVESVQQQTNGNTSRLVDIVEAQGKLLAQMHMPIGVTPPPGPTPPAAAPAEEAPPQ